MGRKLYYKVYIVVVYKNLSYLLLLIFQSFVCTQPVLWYLLLFTCMFYGVYAICLSVLYGILLRWSEVHRHIIYNSRFFCGARAHKIVRKAWYDLKLDTILRSKSVNRVVLLWLDLSCRIVVSANVTTVRNLTVFPTVVAPHYWIIYVDHFQCMLLFVVHMLRMQFALFTCVRSSCIVCHA